MIKRIMALVALILMPGTLWAYNFLYIHPTTGKPIGWGKGATIRYYLDPGKLGRLTNDQAHTLLKEAMKIWENASPDAAVPHFEFAGYLPEDVNGTNYQKYVTKFPCYTDDLSSCPTQPQKDLQTIIVFDEDQSFLNKLSITAGGYAIAGARVFSGNTQNPGNIVQGIVVIGSTAGDPNTPITSTVGRMAHELGHLLGLAHTSINQEPYIHDTSGFERYVPTMFYSFSPKSQVDHQTALATLAPDDIAGISVLYPSDTFSQNTATIKGEILKSDGSPMNHVNVVARNVEDPLCEAYSFLSGRECEAASAATFCNKPVDNNAEYMISDLPSGSYTVEVEEVAEKYLALTLAPGLVNEFIAGDAEFWNDGDQANESNTLSSTITLAAGATKENINVVLNRSVVTDDRIKYIPLSAFTAGPGTRCPETPAVDYAALIGINEGTRGGGTGQTGSGNSAGGTGSTSGGSSSGDDTNTTTNVSGSTGSGGTDAGQGASPRGCSLIP